MAVLSKQDFKNLWWFSNFIFNIPLFISNYFNNTILRYFLNVNPPRTYNSMTAMFLSIFFTGIFPAPGLCLPHSRH